MEVKGETFNNLIYFHFKAGADWKHTQGKVTKS